MQGELLSSDSERTADFDTPARASSTSSTGSRGKLRQLRYGAAADRGPRRTMEDAHIAVSPFWDADLQQAAKPGAQATLDEPCQGFFAVSLYKSTALLRFSHTSCRLLRLRRRGCLCCPACSMPL